ncbi:MAG: hypothetical protein ACK4MV_16300 [Beijerinckiaceae bacterium]
MAEITACPRTLRAVDLNEELRIIEVGKIIRGFRSPKECANRLHGAGIDIAGREVSIAIQREFMRQRMAGERPALRVNYAPPPGPSRDYDWSAVFDDYEAGDPIGRGATAFKAVMDLFDQMGEHHAAT